MSKKYQGRTGLGGAFLWFQHLRNKGRRIRDSRPSSPYIGNLRPAWAM